MPQLKKSYQEVTIPLTKMSFTPDVPSAALGANEYNVGENVETDVRGIRSILGEAEILQTVPGEPVFVTGGFRQGGNWYFIVANTSGAWYMNDGTGWTLITPPSPYISSGYTQNLNITESWNGTVLIINDTINPPFFLPDEANTKLVNYKNNITPVAITNIGALAAGQRTITVGTAYAAAPFAAGDRISITMTAGNTAFTGVYRVISSTTTTITYETTLSTAWTIADAGEVNAAYIWNYNPEWQSLTAGFMRIYSTPNVGNILVAGNLTVVDQNNVTEKFPVSVQWSQAFGLNQAPRTWEPTLLNVANQVEVPLRGEALDAFPSNGQLYISSYWDTAVLTPMNYATTAAPILGIRLFNQGRGLLNANCWANTDDMVYGVDARDIWAFNGQTFVGIGNQRVKHYFFDQLDPTYANRVYVETNTEKNQVEIYYPDKTAYLGGGHPNKMLSYRYDLDVWNAPRDVSLAAFACESPIWTYDAGTSTWGFNRASRTMVYCVGNSAKKLIQKDYGYTFVDDLPINSLFRRDNIKLVKDYSTKTLAHRVLPEAVNLNNNNVEIDPAVNPELVGNIAITVEGANSVGQTPQQTTDEIISTDTDYPWVQISQNAYRVNAIEIKNPTGDDATPGTIWMVTALTWQFTEVEDDR